MTSTYHGFFPKFYDYISETIKENNHEPILLLPSNSINIRVKKKEKILWGTRANWFVHYHLYKIFGLQDIFSVLETLFLLLKLERIKPDLIHMHMMNAWFLNFPLLIKYVNRKRIPIVWTMHDCRAFTGRCAYYDEINCAKWKNGCKKCQQNTLYSPSLFHNEHLEWKIRKSMLNKFTNLTIITPSEWLAKQVDQSFLNKYPIHTIHNGIDLSIFSMNTNPIMKEELGIPNKKMILGIAANWEYRKGLDYFIYLSNRLPQETYSVVLVGTLPISTDNLYKNIINLPRTNTTEELVRIYQSADIFVNPTLADNFPTTNIEALASGIPVVTFNTGGSGESIDETCGLVVDRMNSEALYDAIIQIANNKSIDAFTCRKRAQLFSKQQYQHYINLFEKLVECKE